MIRPREDPVAIPRRDGRVAGAWRAARLAGIPARLGRGQRGMPPGHPGPARNVRAAAVARSSRHLRGAVGVDRLDEQPQRHQAAGLHGPARRGRHRRPEGPRASVGPGRAGLSGRPGGPGLRPPRYATKSTTWRGGSTWISLCPDDLFKRIHRTASRVSHRPRTSGSLSSAAIISVGRQRRLTTSRPELRESGSDSHKNGEPLSLSIPRPAPARPPVGPPPVGPPPVGPPPVGPLLSAPSRRPRRSRTRCRSLIFVSRQLLLDRRRFP
jgi:hypothetical protein